MHTRHWNNILRRNRKDSDETRIWTDLMLRQVARSCQSATHACYFNNYARVPLSVLIDSCCKWGRGELCFTEKAAFCYQPCWRYVAVERTFMWYGFTLHGHALLCYCSRVGLGSLRMTSISTEMQCTLTGQPWRNSSAASHKIKPVIARSAPVHLRCATRNMYTVTVCGIHTVTYRGVSYSHSDIPRCVVFIQWQWAKRHVQPTTSSCKPRPHEPHPRKTHQPPSISATSWPEHLFSTLKHRPQIVLLILSPWVKRDFDLFKRSKRCQRSHFEQFPSVPVLDVIERREVREAIRQRSKVVVAFEHGENIRRDDCSRQERSGNRNNIEKMISFLNQLLWFWSKHALFELKKIYRLM